MPALLTTRCAHCSTLFRVTPAQLQAHGGQVRCGRCMQVFNALEALAPETVASAVDSPSSVTAPAVEPAAESVPAPAEITATPPQEFTNDGPSLDFAVPRGELHVATDPAVPLPDSPADMAAAEQVTAAESVTRLAAEVPAAAEDAAAREGLEVQPPDAAAATPAADEETNPFMAPPPVQAADRRSRHFAAGGFALALLLAVQAVFFYRSDIAARHEPARQWLGAVCAVAGCKVPLPQRPQSVLIEASDLQAGDTAQQGRILLTATLRNHAGHDVGYPALDLVLTNANDHALARRVFLPAEYLGGGRDPGAGLAANAEMTVRLALDTGNLGASGFRLAVLAAPQP